MSEKDLLTTMNVADDQLVAGWSQPDSLDIDLAEFEVLEQIDESEQSDHDKCGLILDLLHRAESVDAIRARPKRRPSKANRNRPSPLKEARGRRKRRPAREGSPPPAAR